MASITEKGFQTHLPQEKQPPIRRVPRLFKVVLRNPVTIAGMLLVLLFISIAVLAPFLSPPSIPSQPYLMVRDGFLAEPQAPSPAHPLGTTQGQYDIYYGIIWGTRTAFKIGIVVTGLSVLIGGIVGSISAYAGGWIDEIAQRVVEIFLAFPFLLAALTLRTILGARFQNGLVTGMIALTVFSWPAYARLVRGDVLAVKERDFILAGRALGAPGWHNLLYHVLPNSFTSLLVVASLDIGANVLTFAALSFLGLGTGEGYADWGQLLSYARNWIPALNTYWWILLYPGLALLLFVLGFNLIGDAFRDALDPKMRGINSVTRRSVPRQR